MGLGLIAASQKSGCHPYFFKLNRWHSSFYSAGELEVTI